MANKQNITQYAAALLLTVFLIFIWSISPLSQYSVQLIALLMIVFISKHILRHRVSLKQENFIDSIIFTSLILTIVSVSGGLNSPLFFLVYFLLFVLSIILTPVIPLIVSFALIIFFLFSTVVESPAQFLPLLSFPLITPLAVYFGRQYQKNLYQRQDIMHLSESAKRETTDVLLWLSTTYERELNNIKNLLDKLPNVTQGQKPIVDKLREEIARLKSLGGRLKEAIEENQT